MVTECKDRGKIPENDGMGFASPAFGHITEDLKEEDKVLKDLDNVIDNAKIGLKVCQSNPF